MARILAALLALGLAASGCAAANGMDYGIPDAANLVRNGSFEAGEDAWRGADAGAGGAAHRVCDDTCPHILDIPYWEGKAAYYRPLRGRRYLELGGEAPGNGSPGSVRMAQDIGDLVPGRYLLVAHAKGHAGAPLDDPAAFPGAAVTVLDPADGSVIASAAVDWVAARQDWVLLAAVVSIRTPRVTLALDYHGPGAAVPPARAARFAVLFDDVRLVALDAGAGDALRRFEERAGLDLSSPGPHARIVHEREFATDALPARKLSARTAAIDLGPGAEDGILTLGEEGSGKAAEAVRDVVVPAPPGGGSRFVSVSAWVWSASPRSAGLALDYDGDKSAESAFHSGSGRWEYLTVVAPYPMKGDALRVTLRAGGGEARFRQAALLALGDDRFDGVLAPQDIGGGRLRERVGFAKEPGRRRIVVVGNSTVNGVAFVAHQASFPYILQLKLETLYPGRFEVVNYGVGAGGLLDQIVSVDHYFKFAANDSNYHLELVNPARSETPQSRSLVDASRDALSIAALHPDVVVIASMWNDLDRLFNQQQLERNYGALDAFLALVDEPSGHRLAEYAGRKKALLDRIERRPPGDARNYAYAWSTSQAYAELSRDPHFYAAARTAEARYEDLLDAFVARASRFARVWSLELPADGGRKAEEFSDRFPDLMLKADGMDAEHRKAIAFYRQVSSGIQSRAGRRVALRRSIPDLDLAASYDAVMEDADAVEWARTEYFVPDLLHFTYRGNEWIADEIYRLMEAELEAMAKTDR